MALEYLTRIVEERNQRSGVRVESVDARDCAHSNDFDYRSVLDNEFDRRCYDDEVNLIMGAA